MPPSLRARKPAAATPPLTSSSSSSSSPAAGGAGAGGAGGAGGRGAKRKRETEDNGDDGVGDQGEAGRITKRTKGGKGKGKGKDVMVTKEDQQGLQGLQGLQGQDMQQLGKFSRAVMGLESSANGEVEELEGAIANGLVSLIGCHSVLVYAVQGQGLGRTTCSIKETRDETGALVKRASVDSSKGERVRVAAAAAAAAEANGGATTREDSPATVGGFLHDIELRSLGKEPKKSLVLLAKVTGCLSSQHQHHHHSLLQQQRHEHEERIGIVGKTVRSLEVVTFTPETKGFVADWDLPAGASPNDR